MVCATASSQSCFCWLYPSLAAKNMINLISVLTIWWCPCVESSLVLLEEGVCYDQCVLLAKLCPASFCTPRPNLPVIPGVSWLLLLHSSPLQWKGHLFGVLFLEGLVGLHGTVQLQLLQRYRLGHRQTWITVILSGLPWKWTEVISLFFETAPSTTFQSLLFTLMATPFLAPSSRYNGHLS